MIRNYLTIDVEDYFQVSAFEDVVRFGGWDAFESRVECNTEVILEVLSQHQIKATFFIVGWIAERYPHMVTKIADSGHQIGCHSYLHKKVYDLTPDEFRDDTMRAKEILEDILGHKVAGYRAPSYSITKKSLWAFDILEELGFEYDSSIFPIYHDVYGIPDAPRFRYKLPGQNLIEYPLSTVRLLGRNIPIAGGGYFRLFPYWFSKMGLKKINNSDKQPFIFYLHPWELDPKQPRMKNIRLFSKFRHYNNLNKTLVRLKSLLTDFDFGPIPSFSPERPSD